MKWPKSENDWVKSDAGYIVLRIAGGYMAYPPKPPAPPKNGNYNPLDYAHNPIAHFHADQHGGDLGAWKAAKKACEDHFNQLERKSA